MKTKLSLLLVVSMLLAAQVQAQTIYGQSEPTPPAMPFRMVDSTDHVTGETGLSPTCTIAVPDDKADFDAVTGTVSEAGNGGYWYVPAAADIDVAGSIQLYCTGTGADPTMATAQVLPTSDGVAQSASGTTLVLASASAYADDELNNNASLYIVSASTGAGQVRCITDYVGSSDTATVATWTTTPTGTIRYQILNTPNCNTQFDVEARLTAARSELSALPGATPSLVDMNMFNYQYIYFKRDATNTTESLYKADESTVLGTWTWSTPTAGTTRRGEFQ